MRRALFALSALLWSVSAHASYVESCALTGVVQNTAHPYRVYFINDQGMEEERIETRFRYRVKTARPNGRADSGCTHLIGQTLRVTLEGAVANKRLRPRHALKLHYNAMNDRGHPDTITTFELLKR